MCKCRSLHGVEPSLELSSQLLINGFVGNTRENHGNMLRQATGVSNRISTLESKQERDPAVSLGWVCYGCHPLLTHFLISYCQEE